MALERVLIPTTPGRARAEWRHVETERHPAAMREAIEREACARIEAELPIGEQVELLARLVGLLLAVAPFGGREVEQLTPERLAEIAQLEKRLAWLLDARAHAAELARKAIELPREQLATLDIREAKNWKAERAPQAPALSKEKLSKPAEPAPGK